MNNLLGILGLIIGVGFMLVKDSDANEVVKKDYHTGSRGIKNNNPGNIIKTKDKWVGLTLNQNDKKFFQFLEPEYGIRAMTIILGKYFTKYDLHTIREIIGRWAPAIENDTDSYVNFVSEILGVEPDEWLVFSQSITGLIDGIIQFENGYNPYPSTLISRGIEMGVK